MHQVDTVSDESAIVVLESSDRLALTGVQDHHRPSKIEREIELEETAQ